jgi:hypothetical protein
MLDKAVHPKLPRVQTAPRLRRVAIARKREALENVRMPYRMKNEEMLRHVGFRAVDVFFKCYNFSGVLGSQVVA